jgi:hypothetical protein
MATDSSKTKEAGDMPYPQKKQPVSGCFLHHGI